MRLILSRKGFDSSAGGTPSPVFPDGSMLSLPIPEWGSETSYAEIAWSGRPVGRIVEELTKGKVRSRCGAHLDPDLRAEALPRALRWRPAFGQAGAAQGVLDRARVGKGDLFLFFGWFREVEERAGRLRFVPGAAGKHVIFGWLRVGRVLAIPSARTPRWAAAHPHVRQPGRDRNTLYVASKQMQLQGMPCIVPGGGAFARYHERLRLSAAGKTRSVWEVPTWFAPRRGRPALGYHEDSERWAMQDGRLLLRSVARGQEFVLDVDHYPEARPWLAELFAAGACGAAATPLEPVHRTRATW
ncbi:MAG: hypothetical protein HY812_17235 [Planctomycetes bacterium]|nr:hypothetical protein [Planctomycetota bacterium]